MMHFVIAETFTTSLARLAGDEQKLAKTTAFDLQLNPANPGHQFHKIERAKDSRFWSVRVSSDLRLIVHRSDDSLLLCYVDHHDDAYRWAERRKLETHPKTGAAQIVEIREVVREVETVVVIERPTAKPRLFDRHSDSELLDYGVPEEWLEEVRRADEDSLFELTEHLPAEASEALFQLALGIRPETAPVAVATTADDSFRHPDALRRFRTIKDADELEAALNMPWDKWALFLHPTQLELVTKDFSGPARVSGSAGTGKTVVALHRAASLLRKYPETRVLLTSFSPILASQLQNRMARLLGSDPRPNERLIVEDLNQFGARLFAQHFGGVAIASESDIERWMADASQVVVGHKFTLRFLLSEWNDVVDAWQLTTWDEYRDVRRLGRKTRLTEAQRSIVWAIFEQVRSLLSDSGQVTINFVFSRLAEAMQKRNHPIYEFVIVDEAQDISVCQLKFLSAIGATRANALFFAGDLGQRIFQTPFSWLSLGVDVRGRSRTLRVNYRTSHQIRSQADRLLGGVVSDVDGNQEERRGTVSVFNGPQPQLYVAESEPDEVRYVGEWLRSRVHDGDHQGLAVIVRSAKQIDQAVRAVEAAGFEASLLDTRRVTSLGAICVSTMHEAKGLEFRAVVVMAVDDEIVPLQERIESIGDDNDLDEVYETERHLLYVACTRARDELLVTSSGSPSEFIEDMFGPPASD